jgi:recombination protein RecT
MSKELSTVDQFKEILYGDSVQSGFGAVLPKDVNRDMFTAVVVRAIQEDPTLLDADRKSLFLSCQDAAKDGLVPDKREGALVVRSTKVNGQWVKKVTWQPMVGGLRKNLARAGFDIRAEVVFENDTFNQQLGDHPEINHSPPPLGEPRGDVIGAYAIATRLSTGDKYREVMGFAELEQVRAVATTDAIWKTWTNEMYRKTVARRLVKFLPITGEESQVLYDMMDRDNRNFEVAADSGPSEAAKTVQEQTRKPPVKASAKPALPKVKPAPKVVTETAAPPAKVAPVVEDSENPAAGIEEVADDDGPGF